MLASSRALSLWAAACAAFAAQSAGVSLLAAAIGIATYGLVEIAAGFARARLRGRPGAALLAPIVIVPALVAGYSVGALGAAWLSVEPDLPGAGAPLMAGLIAGRRVFAAQV